MCYYCDSKRATRHVFIYRSICAHTLRRPNDSLRLTSVT